MLRRNFKPLIDCWNKFTDKQKESVIRGLICSISPHQRVVEKKVTKNKNGSSTFTVYEDEEGNQYGEIWGVHFIRR